MSGVAIVTDTTHYLPREFVERFELSEVSLYVNWPDRQQRESEMGSFDAFYERLRAARDLPTTSQPSVGDFLAVYEPLLDAGRDIISIHLSGGISGTVEAARQAAAQCPPGRVHVLDSTTACGGLGLMAVAAAGGAREGIGIEACLARAREARERLTLWFAIDTLEYLVRGGRIGKAQGMVGSALRIKPILSVQSDIVPIERVRTSGRAFDRLVEMFRTLKADGVDGWVVQHIQAPDVAARLVDAGREIFGTDPVFVSEIGPVIGTHVGPGLIGGGGVPRSLLPL
ncbi:MAG: DegV family protein [Solirubrobacteraceae bacterium]|nr:DegV family protein [Solirubrobacteraceae bacterium]